MDRRGFVTSGMAAGLAGIGGGGAALGSLLDRIPGWSPGKTTADGDVRLMSNENPLGLSPVAKEAAIAALVDANRYPGDYGPPLREELARTLGVREENLTFGFGSTEILQICTQAFQGPNTPLIAAAPTFEDVMDYQDTMPFEVHTVPLMADLQHELFAVMSQRISELETIAGDLSADERIALFLRSLSSRFARRGYSEREFILSMSRRDIASHLRLATETVSRVLARFQDGGLVTVNRKNIVIKDEDGLKLTAQANP